jgi:hypothetical protein
MQQSCNMQPRSHAALFQPQYRTHSSAPSLRLHFSATATPFDFFSCSPGLFCDATTSLAVLAVVFDPTDPCTCLQDGARHDDGQKIPPSEQSR